MLKLGLLVLGLAAPAAMQVCAEEQSGSAFEVGRRVRITLAAPYRTAGGIRVSATHTELAGKPLLTVTARDQKGTITQEVDQGWVEGWLTEADDSWLTLDLGEERPFLRVPLEAVVSWESPGRQARAAHPPVTAPVSVGQKAEIVLALPYRTAQGVRVEASHTELSGKAFMTLAARGQERTITQPTRQGRVRGVLTADDDAWLTLDLGGDEPFLHIPKAAVVRIVHWDGTLPQGTAQLSTGQSVRLLSTELGPRPLTGRLLASDDETLLVQLMGRAEPTRVGRASVEQLWVLRRRSAAGQGALIGGASLAIVGAVIASAGSFSPDQEGPLPPGAGPDIAGGVVMCGVIGVAIGALIGNASTSERWERAPVSLSVAPQRRGGRVALTLRF